MNRLLYVYDYYSPDNEWRVYEALMLHTIGGIEMLMVVVDELGAIHIVKELHITQRISAAFFVYGNEFDLLAANIEQDWNQRHCWKKAYEDVQRLKAKCEHRKN